MKKLLFTLGFLFFVIPFSSAQSDTTQTNELSYDDVVFTIVEQPATFKGGMKKFYKYIKKNLVYPTLARQLGVEGKVFVQFIINQEGKTEDIKILHGIGAGCDEEACRIIRESPQWIPAYQKGKKVKVRMSIPIYFKL